MHKLVLILFATAISFILSTLPASAEPRLVGRFDASVDNVYRFGWPGSEMIYHFKGTYLKADISDSGQNSLMVVIDGNEQRLNLKTGKHQYDVVSGLSNTEHTISIIRITEGTLGPTTVSNVTTDGNFLTVPNRAHRILVVGDSISNGYGVEGKNQSCSFTPGTQNQWLSYSAIAARKFDADLVTLAISGRGLVRNYAGNEATMASLMDRVIPTEPKQNPDDPYAPDLIIIHLGTNDFANKPTPQLGRFIPAYVALIERFRKKFPEAQIYAAIGPMLQDPEYIPAKTAIQNAVELSNQKTTLSLKDVNFIEFRGHDYNYFGCDWHPNKIAQQSMAQKLTEQIQKDLGWSIQSSH